METPDLKTMCCNALDDLKAQNILVLDIREISSFADWFIIATASSSRNAKAISNKLIESLKLQEQHLVGIEGQDDSEWILVDCGDVVVNIMQQDTREFYDLESLWGEKTLVSA
ncbi:ribosome silencing factor [Pseudomonadota bacterium]|nr:ribosome silencing factor [Pseudomonadota bacterium]